jgi:hypothetical protein
MDFSNQTTASIDFSPTIHARNITLVLEEQELATATWNQMERFVRVWCEESKIYAPNLTALTIVLRPSVSANNEITMLGIQKFLTHFQTVRYVLPTNIYLDNWSDVKNHTQFEFMNAPTRLI